MAQQNLDKEKPLNPSQAAIQFMEAARAFETSRITSIQRNSKIAWRITAFSLFLSAIAIGAVMLLTPLKTVEPYVIRVDNNTGQTDIVTSLKEQGFTRSEAMDRFWLKQYVSFREQYDWWVVQSNYDAAMLFSGADEQRSLATFFASDAAPYKVFKQDFRMDVKITSMTWVGDIAQVRFERRLRDLRDPTKQPTVQKMIATVAYNYQAESIPEQDRLINPLGFKVESYRTDTES